MTQNNQPTILQKIVQDKVRWVTEKQIDFPLMQFQSEIRQSDRHFYDALLKHSHQYPAYILECKKASPSKGLIRAEFDLNSIAQVYKNYATVISVLTDEYYFQGNFHYLDQVRQQVLQPVLCKDFIISPYQIYLARYYNADAILLMLSVIDDETYCELSQLAHSLGMGVLTETANESEFARALALGAKVIGINNRNLHDLSIDLNRTVHLVEQFAEQIPEDTRIISESGIYDHRQVRAIKPFAHGFLIGSSLMGSADLNNAVRTVIYGENKVCGLTNADDAINAYQAGALYLGMIFAEKSPRNVNLEQAQKIAKLLSEQTACNVRLVGVFQNQPLDFIVEIANQLALFAVQLHGGESACFIQQLAERLGSQTQVWQAISFDLEQQTMFEFTDNLLISRYILDSKSDSQQGGTGKVFDWKLIPAEIKYKSLLAGGIHLGNLDNALSQDCLGVDLNSGVELQVGVKDSQKLKAIFEKIIAF